MHAGHTCAQALVRTTPASVKMACLARAVNDASAKDVAMVMRELYPCGPADLEKGCVGTVLDFIA
eukprot:10558789-Lingulodinium_polyedra.AAC.1